MARVPVRERVLSDLPVYPIIAKCLGEEAAPRYAQSGCPLVPEPASDGEPGQGPGRTRQPSGHA